MYSNEDLSSAVAAGVLSEQTAEAFRAHVAQQRQQPAVDEEYFRLVTGFNDIFVVIASALLLVAVYWIGATLSPLLGALLLTGTAWGLAEVFTRQRRMALPSMGLLLAFVGGVFVCVNSSLDEPALASGAASLGAWLHWRRFKVPITVAVGVAAGAGLLLAGLVPFGLGDVVLLVMPFVGLGVLALALRWDRSDRQRVTRRADVAFWLHLVAAPLMVHPVLLLLNAGDDTTAPWRAGVVLGVYAVLTGVSLAIDRRALMVSGLAYVLYAVTMLFRQFGAVELAPSLTAFGLGSALLLLSLFWHRCRSRLLQALPTRWQAALPPLH